MTQRKVGVGGMFSVGRAVRPRHGNTWFGYAVAPTSQVSVGESLTLSCFPA